MDRYWQANTSSVAPSVPTTNAGGYPANGKPAVGINGTVPGEWWYYAITEEIRNTIIALGGVPDFTQVDQLATTLAQTFSTTTQSIMARLAKVATSGNYADLSGTPTIPAAQVNSDWNAASGIAQILNRPTLAAVATSGSYTDLSNPPSIPAAQVNSDWNATSGVAQILNKPTSFPAILPALSIEFGHSAQANGGRGIDQGNWYQLDGHIGFTAANGFQYTVNADGTLTIGQGGTYLALGELKAIASGTDTYQLPAQMTVSMGITAYGFPGIYQYNVQRYPDAPTSTASVSGVLGTICISGAQQWGPGNPFYVGFSKVLGSANQQPLLMQGTLSIVKVG
ncbi:hypothetical protein BDI4_340057 [Burkholderia diffusa]|uniref:hypothetical protein n=1 Tax=Burkholderia diffusa TaxID=488732 RepID=UPI001CABCB93|nr:hypothetical protein [Burkholderia diffusa]CAG9252425.1 hypothetical protein BDI4_340057 [Burkholderia diffusa]